MPHFRKYETRVFLAISLLPPIGGLLALWVFPGHSMAVATRDFAAMWAAGRLVVDGSMPVLFDRPGFNAALQTMLGNGFPQQVWSYPPPALLLAVPFAALPLLSSFVLWTFGTAAALWRALRIGGLSRSASAAVLCSPAVAENALAGQNGALTGALLLGSLLLADSRPAMAGLLAGVLVFKPQLGVLLPVCFIASGNGRAFRAATVTAGVIVLASTLLFGTSAWSDFFTRTQPTLAAMLAEPWRGSPPQRIFASPLMAARALGASLPVAYGFQLTVSLLCVLLTWRAWRMRDPDPTVRMALTAPLALAASPWVHTYDMAPLAAAIVVLLACTLRPSPLLLGFAWFWPGAALLLHIPPALELASLGGIAWLAWVRLRAPPIARPPSAHRFGTDMHNGKPVGIGTPPPR